MNKSIFITRALGITNETLPENYLDIAKSEYDNAIEIAKAEISSISEDDKLEISAYICAQEDIINETNENNNIIYEALMTLQSSEDCTMDDWESIERLKNSVSDTGALIALHEDYINTLDTIFA